MIKSLTWTLFLLARITLTLTSSSAIIGCFQNVNFQGFNLVILNFEFPLRRISYSKNRPFYVEIISEN